MKKLLFLLVLLASGLAGGAYWINQHRHPTAVPYTLAPVEYGTMLETVSGTGLFKPQEVVLVAAKVPGEVVEIFPKATFNKEVQEGDPLLKLDDRMARDKLEQATLAVREAEEDVAIKESLRETAEIGVKRLKGLLESRNTSQGEVDQAQAKVRAADRAVKAAQLAVQGAKAALKQAELSLEWTTVKVPSFTDHASTVVPPRRSFTVIDRRVEMGQQVGPQSPPLFTLVSDLSRLDLHVQIAESDIGKVRPGLAVDFTVSSYSDEDLHFRGKVSEIRLMPVSVQSTAVYYEAIVDVRNERDPETGEWRLRPGMTASVDVIRREHKNVWKVPTLALSFHPDDSQIGEAARAKLARRDHLKDRDHWKTVWVLDEQKQPAPLFVRVGGKGPAGEPGIRDSQFTEVLEWDPELKRPPCPDAPAGIPQLITAAPKADRLGGLFKTPIKL